MKNNNDLHIFFFFLTTCYPELVHTIYSEPVDERLMDTYSQVLTKEEKVQGHCIIIK